MELFERIKYLCELNNTNPSKLENDLGFGRGTLYTWRKSSPSGDKLKTVADYFKVSVDYLLGNSEMIETDENVKEILNKKDGLYFKFAKQAEELDLSEDDLQFIMQTYLLHKKHSEKE